jgi:type IV pilus assembly protein PilA
MAAAADQYYLENGATFAASSSLIGPTSYVKALNTVASEIYPDNYTQGITITIAGIANARTITYAP